MSTAVTIEVGGKNRNLFFGPLNRVLRGQFDLAQCAEPTAKLLSSQWPGVIPGVRLSVDMKTGEGTITEPLHEPKHKAIAEQIAKRGRRLPPAEESFPDVHVPSWLQQMKFAVDAGAAKLVDGTRFPDKLPGRPKKSFFVDSPEDQNTVVMARLSDVLDRLADVLERE